ncbi:MAG: hypothetical protein JXA99_09625 [Candidatus Lokiarchaeota archaeon]|nr:hypothetical protein [Candidatus Lokiarchaeota archaeon]
MKKIVYSLNLGTIGLKDYIKTFINKIIKNNSDNNNKNNIITIENDQIKFSLMFKDVLFKIKIHLFEKIKHLLNNKSLTQDLDSILFLININKLKNIRKYKRKSIQKINHIQIKKGNHILIGVNQNKIEINSEIIEKMIERSKILNMLYCFLIEDENKDIGSIFETILDDYVFNFKYSKPDLYELAQLYSKEIQKKPSSFIFLS